MNGIEFESLTDGQINALIADRVLDCETHESHGTWFMQRRKPLPGFNNYRGHSIEVPDYSGDSNEIGGLIDALDEFVRAKFVSALCVLSGISFKKEMWVPEIMQLLSTHPRVKCKAVLVAFGVINDGAASGTEVRE